MRLDGRRSTMINMILILLVSGLVSGAAATTAFAQKRGTRKKAPAETPAPVVDMRPLATEVGAQIGLLSRFLFVYGKAANGLEAAREQATRNQTTPAIDALNRKSRERLVVEIERMAGSIETMTESFRNDPQLQIQYLRIAGARDAILEAADQANREMYTEAGLSLVNAIDRLTETIISMKLK